MDLGNIEELDKKLEALFNPDVPAALSEEFYRSASSFEEIDTQMWHYLLGLIPEDNRSYRDRKEEMLGSVSPELKRYFLTRLFDWERNSGGLEACVMNDPEQDDFFLEETIVAYSELGALERAKVIRELIPVSRDRMRQIDLAESRGEDFDFDESFWEPYEQRWEEASDAFDFYSVIWEQIKDDPSRYTHMP